MSGDKHGCHLDVSMTEGALSMLLPALGDHAFGAPPLRRGKDHAVIYAMRVLARELPATYPRKNHILMQLSAASRQATEGHWPEDTWEGDPPA